MIAISAQVFIELILSETTTTNVAAVDEFTTSSYTLHRNENLKKITYAKLPKIIFTFDFGHQIYFASSKEDRKYNNVVRLNIRVLVACGRIGSSVLIEHYYMHINIH